MIGKLSGVYAGEAGDGTLLLDVHGVSYAVRTQPADLLDMRIKEGDPMTLFIHTAVREDAIDLYGFHTKEALLFFRLLLGVSGVGPKTALGILTASDIPSLKRAIAQGDPSVLTKVYGLGKKSAERIIVELRDKLAREAPAGGPAGASADEEVMEALEALGYSAQEARKALKAVPLSESGVRERLAGALRHLGAPAAHK